MANFSRRRRQHVIDCATYLRIPVSLKIVIVDNSWMPVLNYEVQGNVLNLSLFVIGRMLLAVAN